MAQTVVVGPLTAIVSERWILARNLRLSAECPGWTNEPTIHSIVIESVKVEEAQRREGHCKRFIEALCKDERFSMVVVEAVQNVCLAHALERWGWDYDSGVMDFYWRRRQGG